MNMQKFTLCQKDNIWWGSFDHLNRAGVINGCSCRLHGESKIVPGTLNLALHVGDDRELVLRNRARFARALGVEAARFTTCAQVHGSRVQMVETALIGSGATDYATTVAATDALITRLPGVPLLLFYADCVPILLADPVRKVIGLAHAGWRGTVAGIAAVTVAKMQEWCGCAPEDILAGIGPSIGGCCYEVDDSVRSQALAYQDFFQPRGGGKYLLNLQGINQQQLVTAGLKAEHIVTAGICTAANKELFFSYRQEQGHTGRMGVCLCLPA
jgi:YfiH family protein